jgi:hypothetical protein
MPAPNSIIPNVSGRHIGRILSHEQRRRIERERKQTMKPPDSMFEAIGEAEAETHGARRQVEALRELLAFIRDHVELPEDIITKIDAILRG